MQREAARLGTYRNWPRDKLISPLALAGAGFYYLGQEDRVMCFSCRGTVMCWDDGDNPMEEHRKHFPQCTFLNDPRQAGNIFYFEDNEKKNVLASASSMQLDSGYDSSTQSDSASRQIVGQIPTTNKPNYSPVQYDKESMKDESHRLQSLQSWPKKNIIDITKVAKAGLYFTGQEDKLQCAFCNGSMVNWTNGDDPATEHKKHFGQRCPMVLGNSQGSSNGSKQNGNAKNELSSQLEKLNIIADRPKHPDMANFERRCESFGNWPIGNIQESEALAIAGFYYIGTNDQVRCFFCNVGLSNWDAGDDPWTEHAKWSPKCGYLGLNRNQTDPADEKTEIVVPVSLEEENRRLKEERVCKVCKNRDSQVVFLPCGHIVTCDKCAPTVKTCLKQNCKSTVEGTVKAFMA